MDIEIPVPINEYNHHMGGVDRFDQLKSYYTTLGRHYKTWCTLFHLLISLSLLPHDLRTSALSESIDGGSSFKGTNTRSGEWDERYRWELGLEGWTDLMWPDLGN